MRINDLIVENDVEEAFKNMSQQATQIGAGAAANTATAQRQQRITQLAQNQATRTAAAPGRPLNRNTTAPASGASTTTAGTPGASTAPPVVPPAAPGTPPAAPGTPPAAPGTPPAAPGTPPGTPPAAPGGPTPDPTLNAPLPPADPAAPKRGFVKGLANVVGQTAKGIGAVAGGIKGMGVAAKKGYNAGSLAVGGPGAAPMGNTQVGNVAQQPQQNWTGGGGGNLSSRLGNIERALGLSETFENGKYKLHFESKFLGQQI